MENYTQLLQECKLQLEYLNEKFGETGTTNALLARIDAALSEQPTSKRFIELTREDLVEHKSNLPIDDIGLYDFKISAISRDEIYKAETITFKDGEQMKELKNRYRTW